MLIGIGLFNLCSFHYTTKKADASVGLLPFDHICLKASLPTGNLFGFSALSLVTDLAGIFLNGFTHLFPKGGFFGKSLFTKVLLHAGSPPMLWYEVISYAYMISI